MEVRAAVAHKAGAPLSLETVQLEGPRAGEVLVEIKATGICHTDEFNSRMVCGEPTLEPRTERVPIRMPLPPALAQGSIYENQTALRNRFFDIKAAAT